MDERTNGGLDRLLDSMAEKSLSAIPLNESDYMKDGIWYCGVCGEAKQKIKTLAGKDRLIGIMCRCEREKDEAKRRAEEQTRRMERIHHLKSYGLHLTALSDCTFERDNGCNKNMYIARRYVEQWPKIRQGAVSMVLTGGVGCGKTYLAACIANKLSAMGVPVLMTTASRIINSAMSNMKSNSEDTFLDEMSMYDLLIIDDYGANRGTEYAMEKLFDVIDTRVNSGLPMIITTNLTKEQLQDTSNVTTERIHSRIVGACSIVRCVGTDLRKGRQVHNDDIMRDILKGE